MTQAAVPHHVVSNGRGEISLWPADRPVPDGWRRAGFSGTRQECAAHLRDAASGPGPALPPEDGEPDEATDRAADGATETAARGARAGHRLDTLLLSAAQEHADAVALIADGVAVTYRDLFSRARRLADDLRLRGARPGTFVGVAVDRSADAVSGILGTLLSGAAYVPLDTRAPRTRLGEIAGQAALDLVTGASPAGVAETFALRPVAVPAAAPAPPWAAAPSREAASGADPAYAIFTSGSTGRPKGVVVPHRAVVNSTNARFAVFPWRAMRYLMLAPLTFDAAVAGLFFTLAAGGTLVLPTEEEAKDPGLIAELVTRHAATHLDGVPSQYAAVLEFHAPALQDLTCVIVAGEALSRGLADRHHAALPHVPLFNEYGPTEGTVWSTVHRSAPGGGEPIVPIGAPVEGVDVEVVDENLDPVGPGGTGEIAISGSQLAAGYLGQPDLTAMRFLPHPRRRGQRIYPTGDLGRIGADGVLHYCGRIGSMVKVRGFRVEIGEVEGWLRAQPDVVDAVVVPERFGGTTRLVAIVVKSARTSADRPGLRGRLAEHLPSYMVPSVWREIDRMPLTVNGKIDRDAAAALVGARRADTPYAPATDRAI